MDELKRDLFRCECCNKKEGKRIVCDLCFSGIVSKEVIKNYPELYLETIGELFEQRIEPFLKEIKKEVEEIRTELRIRKIKKR